MKKFKKNKLKLSLQLLTLFILCLSSYYFGAYSFYYKLFPFNPKKNVEIIKDKISTNYHDLELFRYNLPAHSKYGGIETLGNTLLYMSGDGILYSFKDNDSEVSFKKIKIDKIDNGKNYFLDKYSKELGSLRLKNDFSIKDINISKFEKKNNNFFFASTIYYNKKKDCFNLSLFKSEILDTQLLSFSNWIKIFSTKQCLKTDITPKEKFAAASAGGRIIKYDEKHILLSVGDFYADGVNGPILSQKLTNDYGKILKINIIDNTYKIFSYGHRNPQGLFIDKKRNIFSTEHGPDGGDELNLIIENKNYGWPIATFGTQYSKNTWPEDITNNTHTGFQKPIFSWGPKFGISNLILYDGDYFDKWNGNLLITSLVSKSLVRIILNKESNSVNYLETIKLKNRIRDIKQLKNGNIFLLTDTILRDKVPEIILLKKQ